MIGIRVFRATDDPDACQKYIDGHRRILEIHGVTKITSYKHDWLEDPHTMIILVEDKEQGRVLGGARLQLKRSGISLPIELALFKYDSKILDMVQEAELNGGTSELCGLWNSMEVAGMGIGSYILSRIGAAISSQLPITSIFVLCSPVTVRMGRRVGAVVERTLGNNGLFYYPKDDLIATAMILADCDTLVNADASERELIYDLRATPIQKRVERGPKGQFELNYDILIRRLDYNGVDKK
ncbi:hypothetical protein C3K47_16715 [Solitalea longa]|uniref:N-acetyltransferase domain-containing protein n=1 Tax=Solitalea longa TaxID=2079460 RepID=A0A2S4ZYU9_9SPHI|nr:hypothetical protein [Solitalea longa]POY35219.1 hypothetical protein C3K47_16715 [Solitalea longa]